MAMSELEIVKGAAILLAHRLCLDTNSNTGSITLGNLQKKGTKDKPKNFRVTVTELTDEEVEHYMKEQGANDERS